MTKDNLAWLGTLILLIAIGFGVSQKYTIAWLLIAVGIAVIVYAKLKK